MAYNPLELYAGAKETPYGYATSDDIINGRSYLYQALAGNLYGDMNIGVNTGQALGIDPVTLKSVTSDGGEPVRRVTAEEVQQKYGLSDDFVNAAKYTLDPQNNAFMGMAGQVVTPGSKVWNADKSGYYTFNPTTTQKQAVNELAQSAYDPEMGIGHTPAYYQNTYERLIDPNYVFAPNVGDEEYLPSYARDENWQWNPVAEGAKDTGWLGAAYGSGLLPREEWTGTMTQGAWNAIKGLMPAVTGVVGGIVNGAMQAGSGAAQAGTTLSDAASKYITELTGLSKNIVDPVVGFAGNTLQNVATGGKVDAQSLLIGAAGSVGKGVWNEIKAPSTDFTSYSNNLADQYMNGGIVNNTIDSFTPQSYWDSANPDLSQVTGQFLNNTASVSPFADNYQGSLLNYDPNADPFKENFANATEGMSILGDGNKLVVDETLDDPLKYEDKKTSTTNKKTTNGATAAPSTAPSTAYRQQYMTRTKQFSPYEAYKNFKPEKLADYDSIIKSMDSPRLVQDDYYSNPLSLTWGDYA